MKKLSQETFLSRVQAKYGNEYSVLSPYVKQHEKVLVRHNECGYEWMVDPWNLMEGHIKSCPKCSNKWKRTTQDFKQEVAMLCNGEYEVVGEYKSTNSPIKMLHKICGTEFMRTPRAFKRGVGCPLCGRPNYYENTDSFKKRISEKYGENYTVIGKYTSARTKIEIMCNKCGKTWMTTPDNLLRGHGCPICSISRGEDVIRRWLESHEIPFKSQYTDKRCKYKRALRFDFAVFSKDGNLSMLIEYDGKQHFSPTRFNSIMENSECEKNFLDLQIKDQIKNDFCQKNHIKLLRISYKNFDKLESILENSIMKDNPVPSLETERCNDHRETE